MEWNYSVKCLLYVHIHLIPLRPVVFHLCTAKRGRGHAVKELNCDTIRKQSNRIRGIRKSIKICWFLSHFKEYKNKMKIMNIYIRNLKNIISSHLSSFYLHWKVPLVNVPFISIIYQSNSIQTPEWAYASWWLLWV